MKKLNKIKLQDAVVLENQEMKRIFGGSGGSSCDGGGHNNSSCTGTCDPRYVWNKETMMMDRIEQSCQSVTLHDPDFSGFFTMCGCS